MIRKTVITICSILLYISPVTGHPHIFVTVSPVFVFEDNEFRGIRVNWLFDAIFSEQILECDVNCDNKFDPEETETVREDFFRYIENVDYLTVISINKNALEELASGDFSAVINPEDGTVTYSFFMPVSTGTVNNISEIRYIVNDPTILVAFESCGEQPAVEGADRIIEDRYVREYSYYGYEFVLELKDRGNEKE